MKKILLVAFALTTITSAFAQRGYESRHDRDISMNRSTYPDYPSNRYENRYNSTYYFTDRERKLEVQKINLEFDNRIRAIRNNRFMRSYDKSRQITFLERERDAQIRSIQARYYDNRNKYLNNRSNRNGYGRF